MRAVFGLVLLIGMGLAGFAVYLANNYFAEQEAKLRQVAQRAASAVQTVDIYAPKRDMTYGELITPDDIHIIKYAADFLPEGVFRTEEELFPLGTSTPRVVRRPMETNEPILAVKVTEAGAPRGITALLKPGMAAFPLSDNMTEAFAGELRVSDRIDLYWVGSVGRGPEISRLVKERLEIIAMDEPDNRGRGGGGGVVLEVTQQDFADLQVLRSSGRLTLTPVATSDISTVREAPVDTNLTTILGIKEPERVVEEVREPEPEECFIIRQKGTERERVVIPCSE
ncbi:Flp pilus assembly protein CpaB [Yoonia sediminilitoris]|uniref:Pilus assembly protein CpaB n=1 Tax=Yoonia sediminilitoris TaxID=1286148 RepID=A0A2T6KK35_9RHOB|nr:Flp pilus assembly protein CpaB [Yoonia sediminilitoris]PUB16316.1 pilus assembly protein CpaB [Yoonia sediminilitoris]RCW96665.1 pilus assembly protein CpaB [Yoonia sediminilitoris]